MTSITLEGYNISFSRLRMPKDTIVPKLVYDKNPIRAESFNDIIYDRVDKPKLLLHPNEMIHHSNIETMWKTGNYDCEQSPFKIKRLTNITEISKYYMPQHTVRYDVDVPFFMPTDKIYLNNSEQAIKAQWNIFTSKTGITRTEQEHMNLVDLTGANTPTSRAPSPPPLAPPPSPPPVPTPPPMPKLKAPIVPVPLLKVPPKAPQTPPQKAPQSPQSPQFGTPQAQPPQSPQQVQPTKVDVNNKESLHKALTDAGVQLLKSPKKSGLRDLQAKYADLQQSQKAQAHAEAQQQQQAKAQQAQAEADAKQAKDEAAAQAQAQAKQDAHEKLYNTLQQEHNQESDLDKRLAKIKEKLAEQGITQEHHDALTRLKEAVRDKIQEKEEQDALAHAQKQGGATGGASGDESDSDDGTGVALKAGVVEAKDVMQVLTVYLSGAPTSKLQAIKDEIPRFQEWLSQSSSDTHLVTRANGELRLQNAKGRTKTIKTVIAEFETWKAYVL